MKITIKELKQLIKEEMLEETYSSSSNRWGDSVVDPEEIRANREYERKKSDENHARSEYERTGRTAADRQYSSDLNAAWKYKKQDEERRAQRAIDDEEWAKQKEMDDTQKTRDDEWAARRQRSAEESEARKQQNANYAKASLWGKFKHDTGISRIKENTKLTMEELKQLIKEELNEIDIPLRNLSKPDESKCIKNRHGDKKW